MTTVDPADLRFTQESIACHFKAPHEHFNVREALRMIQTGQMSPDDFPKLRVISHEGSLWSMDNRRLWVFRKASCSQITVKMMTTMHHRLEELITYRSRYMRLSDADFVPRVRGSQNVSPAPLRVAQKGLHPRVAEVMSRYNLLERARGSHNVLPMPRVDSPNVHCEWQGFVSRLERPSSRPGILLPSSSTTGLQSKSSSAMACVETISSSRPLGGRLDSDVTRPQPVMEPIVDIHHFAGTQEQWTSARTPLLSAPTQDDGRPTESWFAWARTLIFGCFGCA